MSKEYDALILALAPNAYWKCDEQGGNLVDSSGNGNTAVKNGAPTYGAVGPIAGDPGTAVTMLNNNANYFEAPNSASLNVVDTFTIIFWVKITIGTLQRVITQAANGYDVSVDAAGNIQLAKDGVAFMVTATTPMTGGVWHMVVMKKSGGNSSVGYLDDVQVTPADASGLLCTGPGGITEIGRNANGGGNPLNGSVGRIALWGSILTTAQCTKLYQAAIASNLYVQPTVTCVWRAPSPPHSALFTTTISAAKWQRRVRGMGTASLLVPKSDANAAQVAKLLAKCVPMITLERSDGNLPFVGFPVDPRFKRSDTHGALQLADHTMLLTQASTRIVAETRQSSGRFIIQELTEAAQRAEPPLYLDLRQITDGPAASLALSGGTLEAMIRELEKQTGLEAFLTYQISPAAVVTSLQWRARQGKDRRTEDRWIDGEELADLQYNLNYRAGKRSVTSVGGSGSVPARPSATTTISAPKAIGATVSKVVARGRAGYGGAQVDFVPQVTDPQLLAARNVQVLGAPANAAVSWEFSVVESRVDMSKVNMGDIRRIASQDALMGQPVSGIARIISMELNSETGVHQMVAVAVP